MGVERPGRNESLLLFAYAAPTQKCCFSASAPPLEGFSVPLFRRFLGSPLEQSSALPLELSSAPPLEGFSAALFRSSGVLHPHL